MIQVGDGVAARYIRSKSYTNIDNIPNGVFVVIPYILSMVSCSPYSKYGVLVISRNLSPSSPPPPPPFAPPPLSTYSAHSTQSLSTQYALSSRAALTVSSTL